MSRKKLMLLALLFFAFISVAAGKNKTKTKKPPRPPPPGEDLQISCENNCKLCDDGYYSQYGTSEEKFEDDLHVYDDPAKEFPMKYCCLLKDLQECHTKHFKPPCKKTKHSVWHVKMIKYLKGEKILGDRNESICDEDKMAEVNCDELRSALSAKMMIAIVIVVLFILVCMGIVIYCICFGSKGELSQATSQEVVIPKSKMSKDANPEVAVPKSKMSKDAASQEVVVPKSKTSKGKA